MNARGAFSSHFYVLAGKGAGHLHRRSGTACQDAVGYLERKGILACVLADGAGSASEAHAGAQAVVRSGLEFLSKVEWSDEKPTAARVHQLGEDLVSSIRLAIGELAGGTDADMSPYNATMLAAVLGQSQAIFFQIGDGLIAHRLQHSEHFRISPSRADSEFANLTNFVTMENAPSYLTTSTIQDPVEFVIMTSDGLSGSMATNGMPHEPAFEYWERVAGQAWATGLDGSALDRLLTHQHPFDSWRFPDDKSLILAIASGGNG